MVLLVAAGFLAGFIVARSTATPLHIFSGNSVTIGEAPEKNVDMHSFWHVWQLIEEKYIKPTDRENLLWGSVQGMVKSLDDPYSIFLPPAEKKEFDIEITGQFEGVGMEIGIRKGILTVVAPLKNTPAYKAGIKAGDKIIKINDEITADITIDQAVKKIRGPRGTEVMLTILRNGEDEPLKIAITRDVINIPTLDSERHEDVFVIKLYNFNHPAPAAFRNALRGFVNSGSDKLIIDLRNNPGGFLEIAVDITSWFLPVGKVITTEDFSARSGRSPIVYRSKGYDAFKNLPLVVLVNKGSASASEIFAGALRDYGLAKLVGEKTFGKGTVQELIAVTPDTSLKLTVAQWLTPNGKSIEEGLEPDIKIEMTEDDEAAGHDSQLERAIDVVRKLNVGG